MNLPAAKPQPLGDLIARLSSLHPKRIDLSLDRMQRLLERLGHPERKLPPAIHVAGTNGKGSTIAYLRAILEAAWQEDAIAERARSLGASRSLTLSKGRGEGMMTLHDHVQETARPTSFDEMIRLAADLAEEPLP